MNEILDYRFLSFRSESGDCMTGEAIFYRYLFVFFKF